MTCPSRTMLVVMGAVGLLLLAAPVWGWSVAVVAVADVVVVVLCLVEGRALRRRGVVVERRWPGQVQLNRAVDLVVVVSNRSGRRVEVGVRQPWPAALGGGSSRQRVAVDAGQQVELGMTVLPVQRGVVVCRPLEVEVGYPGGMARRRWVEGGGGRLKVYPDLQALVEYEQLRRSRALKQMGIHRVRTVGLGREFEQLREYLPDDDYRQVNWKATARRHRPVTNVYQVERSRDVMLCVECGRMMGNPVGRGTALDRAVDAAIMLAHVSNRQGDRTGLVLFGQTVELLLRPRSGRSAVRAVIERLVEAEPRAVFPTYAALAEALRLKQNHRSLVFLFTDLNDPQLVSDLAEVMPMLTARHMVVVVSLRDALVERVAGSAPRSRAELFEVLAARQLAEERQAHCRALVKAGVHVLEADAERLTLQVINTYLAIKQRQLL